MNHGSPSVEAPYIGSPLENLTLSDPRCNNDSCRVFYDAHQLSQKKTPYAHQFDYGHYVSWYLLVSLGLFSIAFWFRRWNEARFYRGRTSTPAPAPARDKILAAWRLAAYKRAPGWLSGRLSLPSMGVLIFFSLAILYNCLLTFAVHPYYRGHRGYGSPPIAVRTGLMATALTPWILALSAKANIISWLTGIGHEKLNVVHRWMSWLCLGLSIVHTVPFIVAPLRDGGPAQLRRQYYKPGGYEFTGTPPLGMLFGLTLLSLPWIRHRLYECFYHVHFWLAVSYVGTMFWHCSDQGDSWAYMWATLLVWVITILMRVFWKNRSTNLSGPLFTTSSVTTTLLPDDMVGLEITASEGLSWHAGEHMYIRIPTLSAFDNHPFTIANAYIPTLPGDQQSLRFFVRPYTGFTRRLHDYLSKHADSQLTAMLDGPYGSYHADNLIRYDTLVLVAGGGGISAILPWVEEFALRYRSKSKSKSSMRVRTVRVHWSIRHGNAVGWVRDALEKLDLPHLGPNVHWCINVTGEEGGVSPSGGVSEKAPATSAVPAPLSDVDSVRVTMKKGRIQFSELFEYLPEKSRVLVIGCGPESLKTDLSNQVSHAQTQVLRGKVAEIALQTETFGW